jgi:hypothetical protein
MAIPPEIEAEALLDRGFDPRALVGGMGRLFFQMMNEHLSADERIQMVEGLSRALTTTH